MGLPGTSADGVPATLRGDSWEGFPQILISSMTETLESAKMQWRDAQGVVQKEFIPDIVESAAPTWELSIPQQVIDIAAGRYNFDLQCTTTAGNVYTFWRDSIEIQQDVTQP